MTVSFAAYFPTEATQPTVWKRRSGGPHLAVAHPVMPTAVPTAAQLAELYQAALGPVNARIVVQGVDEHGNAITLEGGWEAAQMEEAICPWGNEVLDLEEDEAKPAAKPAEVVYRYDPHLIHNPTTVGPYVTNTVSVTLDSLTNSVGTSWNGNTLDIMEALPEMEACAQVNGTLTKVMAMLYGKGAKVDGS